MSDTCIHRQFYPCNTPEQQGDGCNLCLLVKHIEVTEEQIKAMNRLALNLEMQNVDRMEQEAEQIMAGVRA